VRRLGAAAITAALLAPAALAQSVDESGFRYVRPAEAPVGAVAFEPDGPLFAHSKPELADLRIVDSAGRQVPWRRLPLPSSVRPPRAVLLLNSGLRSGKAVALLDLGPNPGVHDQVVLDVPDSDFVGRVEVSGSDRRKGPFTFLSTTVIYDISGAPPARSTTAVYPPSDFRYLSLSATDVSKIAGASVLAGRSPRPDLLERPLRSFSVRSETRQTIATADLGFRNMPVDEIRVRARTKLYDRPIQVEGSNTGESWVLLAQGRVFRFSGSVDSTIPLQSRHRFLRLTIENGDDAPLEGLRIEASASPRTILVAEDFRPPYRLLYGNPGLRAPEYDFAQAPLDSVDADSVPRATLGREALNPAWQPPEDTRSFTARHPQVLPAALAVAAAVLFAAAFLALRRRTETPSGG
jgi:hypothetical protein